LKPPPSEKKSRTSERGTNRSQYKKRSRGKEKKLGGVAPKAAVPVQGVWVHTKDATKTKANS